MVTFSRKKQIYYVNFCQQEDFDVLQNRNINVTNSIVMCRYGLIFRGNKVQNAYLNGAKAVLLFDDPLSGASSPNNTYPNNIYLPKDGTQRGTLFMKEGLVIIFHV